MADEQNLLGDYLRARRELVTPDQVGIPVLGRRRVKGLRREEVAMLAGVSADYYLRLEQGRDRNPSVQVLESIARVLQLDEHTTAYLLGLGAAGPRRVRPPARRETVPVGILTLLDTLDLPAFVEGRYFDVLAANRLAAGMSPRLVPGRNRMRDIFLDPDEGALYPQWERAAAGLIAGFRQSVGTATDDPGYIALVDELLAKSDAFRALWGRHDVGVLGGGAVVLRHPQVGDIRLYREKLGLGGTGGLMLVIYHPEPASRDADRLSLLASTALSVG